MAGGYFPGIQLRISPYPGAALTSQKQPISFPTEFKNYKQPKKSWKKGYKSDEFRKS